VNSEIINVHRVLEHTSFSKATHLPAGMKDARYSNRYLTFDYRADCALFVRGRRSKEEGSDGKKSYLCRRYLQTRKRLATRQKISDVATRLFIERGFYKVTMDQTAEAADVSRMTVFNHFSRKRTSSSTSTMKAAKTCSLRSTQEISGFLPWKLCASLHTGLSLGSGPMSASLKQELTSSWPRFRPAKGSRLALWPSD
jgi:hypothetical protein